MDLERVFSLAFSGDGKCLLAGGLERSGDDALTGVRLWDVETQTELLRFGGQREILSSVALSPDGKLAAAGYLTPYVGERVPSIGYSGRPVTVFAPDFGPGTRTLKLFDLVTKQEINRFEYSQPVSSIKFAPDGIHLLTVGSECLLWNLEVGRIVYNFQPAGFKYANGVDISIDGLYLAFACGTQPELGRYEDRFVRIWRRDSPKEIAAHPCERPVNRVAFVPGKNLVVAGGDVGELRVWPFEG